jgi:hypothetical protein
VLSVFAALVALDSAPKGYFPLDQSIVFDGGWRLLIGQRPVVDFSMPSGLPPSALQALFFFALGPSWLAYGLHAALANAGFSMIVYILLRQAGAPRSTILIASAASAVVFAPPIGTPYPDLHAFLFSVAAIAVVAARRGSAPESIWSAGSNAAAATLLLGLGFLSKQSPATFLAPIIAGLWILRSTLPKGLRVLGARLVGAAAALVCLLTALRAWTGASTHELIQELVATPASVGRGRLSWLVDERAARVLAELFRTWLRPSLLLAFLALAFGWWLLERRSARASHLNQPSSIRPALSTREVVLLGFALLVASGAYGATTFRPMSSSLVLVFLVVGLFAAAVARWVTLLPGRSPLASLVILTVNVVITLDAWHFHSSVNLTRASIGLVWPAPPEPATVKGLDWLQWALPAFVPWSPADLEALTQALEAEPGDLFILGDTTLLAALVRKTPTSPVVWYHPRLTVPWRRTGPSPAFQKDLVRRLERSRLVVLEGPATQMGVGLDQMPVVVAYLETQVLSRRRFGGFELLVLDTRPRGSPSEKPRGRSEDSASSPFPYP